MQALYIRSFEVRLISFLLNQTLFDLAPLEFAKLILQQELYAEDNEMQENDDEMSLSCVTINSSRSSSCSSEEELVDTQTAELLIDTTSILIAMIATDISFNSITALPGRIGNQHRNREQAITECRSWDDAMFKRQFRLSRRAYNNLIQIIYPALQVNITRCRMPYILI